jgi:hypothetical protein
VKHEHDEARERLMDQVLSATSREEIAAAWKALQEWIARFPEEEGMRDGFEQLSLMQDVIEIQESRRQQGTKQVA